MPFEITSFERAVLELINALGPGIKSIKWDTETELFTISYKGHSRPDLVIMDDLEEHLQNV